MQTIKYIVSRLIKGYDQTEYLYHGGLLSYGQDYLRYAVQFDTEEQAQRAITKSKQAFDTFHSQNKYECVYKIHKLTITFQEVKDTDTTSVSLLKLKYIRAVSIFCYNRMSSADAYQIGKEICGECWAYKFGEVVNNYNSRAWGEELLCQLPPEQANQFMEHCYQLYKDHPLVLACN